MPRVRSLAAVRRTRPCLVVFSFLGVASVAGISACALSMMEPIQPCQGAATILIAATEVAYNPPSPHRFSRLKTVLSMNVIDV